MRDQDRDARALLEGRIAFAAAALALSGGLILLLDRIGLPALAAKGLAVAIALGAIALIGSFVRAARITSFYAANRALPASYAGLAIAAIVGGMAFVLLPPTPDDLPLAALLAGVALGLFGLAALTAPLLRKSGAYSLADLIAARFPAAPIRVAIVIAAGAVGALTAAAGLEEAIRLLGQHLGLARGAASALLGAVLALTLVPGGLSGLVWGAAAAGGVLLASLALPALVMTGHDGALPAPLIGDPDAWAHAAGRLAEFARVAQNAAQNETWLAVPLALALLGFAPLALASVSARNRAGAQYAISAGTIWIVLLVFAGLACAAFGAIGLDLGLAGQRPDRLADAIYQASGDGWVTICGQSAPGPAQARAACAAWPGFSGVLRPSDFSTSPAFLLFGLARIQGIGGAYEAFVLAGAVAVCMALAAAGLQCAAAALGHDLWYRLRDRAVITSRRLATTRLMLVALVVALCMLVGGHGPDPRAALGLALTLAACAITPLLVLCLWPRAGSLEAGAALASGVGVAATFLWTAGSAALSATELGLAAAAGCSSGLAIGVLVSLRPGVQRTQGEAFRQTILRGPAEAITPDRGA